MHDRVYSPPMRSLLQVIEGDLVAILEHQEEAKQLIDQIHSLLSSVSFNKHTYHSSYCFVFVMIFIKYIMLRINNINNNNNFIDMSHYSFISYRESY